MRMRRVAAENVFNVLRHDRKTGLAPRRAAMTDKGCYRQLLANHGANNTGPEKLRSVAINR
ncbi:hypothetical protein PUN4_970004 [Paraburkholderia unamae]|nr:hypothetical protein C7401_1395 [Paraburkholderia unamae]CAG9275114.1 hypothetical protein PUN4_970004 [Paraburkholderia unamae]